VVGAHPARAVSARWELARREDEGDAASARIVAEHVRTLDLEIEQADVGLPKLRASSCPGEAWRRPIFTWRGPFADAWNGRQFGWPPSRRWVRRCCRT